MSIIEERLRFQELEPTGRLLGIPPRAPLAPRPGERFILPSPPRPCRGDKGYQQWEDYLRQAERPTYLGNPSPYAQLTATLTNRPQLLPGRPQTLNFTPRPPVENYQRPPNPLYCNPRESAAAARGRPSKAQQPRMEYNTITGDSSSIVPRGMGGAPPDARIMRALMIRRGHNRHGKGAMKPTGGGSQAVVLISGSSAMDIGYNGQSARDFNTAAARAQRWRDGDRSMSSNRQLTGMQSSGMQSIMGLPNPTSGQLPPMPISRRVNQPARCSPRTRVNGGVNPITGRSYDPNIERQRENVERSMRERQLKRDTTGEMTREEMGGILTGRAGMPPNWLPATKRVVAIQKTQLDGGDRSAHFRQSKRVYAQANKRSDWSNGPAVTPKSGSSFKPADTGAGVIFGGGKKSNVLGPRGGGFNAKKEGAARPGFFKNSANMGRF